MTDLHTGINFLALRSARIVPFPHVRVCGVRAGRDAGAETLH